MIRRSVVNRSTVGMTRDLDHTLQALNLAVFFCVRGYRIGDVVVEGLVADVAGEHEGSALEVVADLQQRVLAPGDERDARPGTVEGVGEHTAETAARARITDTPALAGLLYTAGLTALTGVLPPATHTLPPAARAILTELRH